VQGVNPALVVTAGVVAYHDTKFRGLEPFPDVRPFLAAARAAGLRLGIVTHGWTVKQAEKLVRLRITEFLDQRAIFISDQVGISKPNPKLYAVALRALDLQPPEAMMIGDNLENDIAPPKTLGMRTTWARRSAREQKGVDVTPDHVVDDFLQLTILLREEYGIDIAD
jgi:putative hydrolase of the HAD superfamily